MLPKQHTVKTALLEAFPLALAIAAYGLSYGVLATQAHWSLWSTIMMSVLVFSGSVQLMIIAMVISGATLPGMIITAVLLNLRNLLYGAALADNLAPASRKYRWLLAFGVSDESFVLGNIRYQKYGADPLYFGVVAGLFYGAWVIASYIGAYIGDLIDPVRWGLDLAFPITFVALLIPSLTDKPIIATAVTALGVASILHYIMPTNEFNLIITGVISPFVGMYIARRQQHV
ncbi:4-azaleucine resistance transporter AzlC [Paenibacillus sp. SORGH_AS306]|uniref:AzlC family ABC transporter permease n=1 Tax=unclassified Paenibacillus TaxID=185978 RepID=UPI0027853837|nr:MULTISPECIES: AzlC family ABC transporter permease [unclassified Paenibacillus]MDQ1236732.1 4-azaleucine resistance transporter AzlC [Paenibacillus sp. SORGH_AS_0306]MDR6109088.1 4-azaleucine resistance transporter AzlC [Paenibacillus sp. SORGH_AS_0338]